MQPVILRTERLVLSMPTLADVDAITAACQDPEVSRWTTVPSPYTRKDGEDFVGLVADWWADGVETVWAIRRSDELAGMIGLHKITSHAHGGEAEIGYWGTAAHRGQGVMGEAGRAVVTSPSTSWVSPASRGGLWSGTCLRRAPPAGSDSGTRGCCARA